ncbi:hypothetical protein BH10ACT7_BH10ACT7_11280 [soil metagenome]
MSLKSRLVSFASQTFPRASSRVLASSGYTLDLDSFGEDAFTVWGADAAGRQDRAWQPLVAQAIAGDPREDIAALFSALDSLEGANSILEVGCGGGYNSELIAHRAPKLSYVGVDLAESMVEISRRTYPNREFAVASALDLPYDTDSFDVVMDGVALLHIPDWADAIKEYARVTAKYVILHGLTLTDDAPTTPFAKYAYGQPSRELVFNRTEMLSRCEEAQLTLQGVYLGDDYDLEDFIGIKSVSETWVLTV